MNEDSLSSTASLPLSSERRLDAVCDRYEAAWRAGQKPTIEPYLAEVTESERLPLFRLLLPLELELRRRGGRTR
jgi:serine/threonine-protein kinase